MRMSISALMFTIGLTVVSFTASASAHLHPGLERFVQRDPLAYVDGAALYQYERSIPTQLLDPSGRNGIPTINPWCLCSALSRKSDAEICAHGQNNGWWPPHPGGIPAQGGVACLCGGLKKVICTFHIPQPPGPGPNPTPGEPPAATAIIEECIKAHEQCHIDSPRTQCPRYPDDGALGRNPGVSWQQEECPCYRKQLDCLRNKIANCPDQLCKDFVNSNISSVIDVLNDRCGGP
jgi:hypothetical protein